MSDDFDLVFAELMPLALAYARGRSSRWDREFDWRENPYVEAYRVKVSLRRIVASDSYVAELLLDEDILTLSDPWPDRLDALENLRWLLCGTGPLVRPSVTRQVAEADCISGGVRS